MSGLDKLGMLFDAMKPHPSYVTKPHHCLLKLPSTRSRSYPVSHLPTSRRYYTADLTILLSHTHTLIYIHIYTNNSYIKNTAIVKKSILRF